MREITALSHTKGVPTKNKSQMTLVPATHSESPLGHRVELAAIVAMPEAPMDEDDSAVLG